MIGQCLIHSVSQATTFAVLCQHIHKVWNDVSQNSIFCLYNCMHVREYKPMLMPKEDIQCINIGTEYCRYRPYFGICALNDLYT